MNAALQAILSDNDAQTIADLARTLYKYTDAGVSLAARLEDGTPVWNGRPEQRDPAILPRVMALGVSSIVEGSDAEVPLRWLDLGGLDPAEAVAKFDAIVEDVNDEACALWDEANAPGDD